LVYYIRLVAFVYTNFDIPKQQTFIIVLARSNFAKFKNLDILVATKTQRNTESTTEGCRVFFRYESMQGCN
ncbi:hypothetical protein, partial [Fischerella thermalis]